MKAQHASPFRSSRGETSPRTSRRGPCTGDGNSRRRFFRLCTTPRHRTNHGRNTVHFRISPSVRDASGRFAPRNSWRRGIRESAYPPLPMLLSRTRSPHNTWRQSHGTRTDVVAVTAAVVAKNLPQDRSCQRQGPERNRLDDHRPSRPSPHDLISQSLALRKALRGHPRGRRVRLR